jgi:chromosomal replication initiation ATPase DnaA
MSQYTLSITLPAVYAETNFVVSPCNETAYKRIISWPAWQALLISGTSGSGKTHLGHIWAARADAERIDCKTQKFLPEHIHRNLWLDDAEYCDEETLLHTLNYTKEQNISLLLTTALPAGQLPFTLPDLTSRLRALPAAIINTPDDEVLSAVLRKQFADLQIKISDEVIAYLLTHTERSFAAIARAVETLDKQTLENKRGLTIPFIRQVLYLS